MLFPPDHYEESIISFIYITFSSKFQFQGAYPAAFFLFFKAVF